MRREVAIETLMHMIRVSFISISFVNENKNEINVIRFRLFLGAVFHDIGKFKLNKKVLNAKRKLTKEEMIYVREHVLLGEELLKCLKKISQIIKYHHENFDGSGYYGLKDNAIPIESQLIRLADVYDSLTHKRPYKDALSISVALEVMKKEEKNFNPIYLSLFIKHVKSKYVKSYFNNLKKGK